MIEFFAFDYFCVGVIFLKQHFYLQTTINKNYQFYYDNIEVEICWELIIIHKAKEHLRYLEEQ